MAKRRSSGEAGDWFSSLRFSGFTVLIVALVIVGGVIVSPTLTTYINQQRELAELRESVRLQSENVEAADAARAKWLDPAYVRSQARSRLFYVMPGEMQLSVISDIVIPEDSEETTEEELTTTSDHWVATLGMSTLAAGLAAAPIDEVEGEPAEASGADGGTAESGDAPTGDADAGAVDAAVADPGSEEIPAE